MCLDPSKLMRTVLVKAKLMRLDWEDAMLLHVYSSDIRLEESMRRTLLGDIACEISLDSKQICMSFLWTGFSELTVVGVGSL